MVISVFYVLYLAVTINLSFSADEFLVGVKNQKIVADLQQMRRIFADLPIDGYVYKLQLLNAVPCNQSCRDDTTVAVTRRATSFYIDEETLKYHKRKTFYYSKSFVKTEEGNHYGSVTVDKECSRHDPLYNVDGKVCQHQDVPLGVIHYGWAQSFVEYNYKMTRGAIARGYAETVHDPKMCTHAGAHYCQHMVNINKYGIETSRRQFEEKLDRSCARPDIIYFPSFGDSLRDMETRAHEQGF